MENFSLRGKSLAEVTGKGCCAGRASNSRSELLRYCSPSAGTGTSPLPPARALNLSVAARAASAGQPAVEVRQEPPR